MARVDEEEEGSAGMEKCGFVCHVILVPLGLGFWTLSLLPLLRLDVPETVDSNSEILWSSLPTIHSWSESVRSWSVLISTGLVGLFLAAPILYCGVNLWAVAPSEYSLTDEYTRERMPESMTDTTQDSQGLGVYDIDVAEINDLISEQVYIQ
jgi:hypothetical protein